MNPIQQSSAPPIPEDAALTVMEDLNPEPSAPTWHSLHLERVFGLVLVLTTTLLGAGQFWVENVHHSAYQDGVRAAQAQDWDAAQAAYAAADGYADAPQRAAIAGQMVSEVQALDQQAAATIRHCDSTGLAAVVRRLQQIAPHASATERLGRVAAAVPNWLPWCRPGAAVP